MGMRKGTERGREVVGASSGRCPSAVSRQRRYRASRAVAVAVGAALMTVPAVATGKGAPCAAHTTSTDVTRAECLRAHRAQVKRDRMAWPPRPTVREVRVRVERIGGPGTWAKAWRVARCETGANPRHYPHGAYIGMMGMARSTYAYGARVTGYPYPATATPQEQIAVAVASFPITLGWSGWGCGGA